MKKYFFAGLPLLWLFATCSSMEADQLPYYTGADFTPQWMSNESAESVHKIPAFTFVNQLGNPVTEETLSGKITVVNFFFASCPGICKKLTNNMGKVQDAYKLDPEVQLLSHSTTPEMDSVPVLNEYAAQNKVIAGKWHLVTGSRRDIYSVARNAYFADEDLGIQQDSTTFLHTENIMLIDKNQHIRGIYKGTLALEIENLVADIKKLKLEQ
jgi:protein SCO1/2